MRFRTHTLWMILTAMLFAAVLAGGRQQAYPFSTPEVKDTQIEKDIGLGMNYAFSLPILKLPVSFYSYDIPGYDFTICLKTLRIRSMVFVRAFPAEIIYHIITINGP